MKDDFYGIFIMVLFAVAVIMGTKHFNTQEINKGTKAVVTKEKP